MHNCARAVYVFGSRITPPIALSLGNAVCNKRVQSVMHCRFGVDVQPSSVGEARLSDCASQFRRGSPKAEPGPSYLATAYGSWHARLQSSYNRVMPCSRESAFAEAHGIPIHGRCGMRIGPGAPIVLATAARLGSSSLRSEQAGGNKADRNTKRDVPASRTAQARRGKRSEGV